MPKATTKIPHSDVKFTGNVRQVVSTITVTTDRETRPFTQPNSPAATTQTASAGVAGQP